MSAWKMFSNKPDPQQVTTGRFEIERDGKIAYLEYTMTGKILGLIHTEVPDELRHEGIASQLAETALQWARDHNFKVDVVCPNVLDYISKHPEYNDLVMH